jgi:FKBP-type peptidyl-prolyl cis-trans isomerase 2
MIRANHSIRTVGIPLIAVLLSGCATMEPHPAIKAGDKVGIQFTCRLKNGELAAATSADDNNSSLPKSPLFLKRTTGDDVVVTAGADTTEDVHVLLKRPFESWITAKLAGSVVGMRQRDEAVLEVTAERLSTLPPADQFIKLPRVRKQPKEMNMPLDKFKALTKKDPVVGQPFIIDPAIPGTVASVSGDEVLLRFAPTAKEVELIFGKGVISEKEDHYEIDIQAVKGTLLRPGGVVARISDVDSDTMTIDFAHPFAGEALNCDVKVMSVQPGEKIAAVNGDVAITKSLNDALAKAAGEKTPASPSGTVERGDRVKVNYTATLNDGTVFGTTLESVAKDPLRKKVSWFRAPANYAAGELVAGKDELLPGLGEAVVGLEVGAKKELRLTADKAFGQPDSKKMREFPCARTLPLIIRMPKEAYVKQLSSQPALNNEVDLIPYFKAKVTEVSEKDVVLQFLAKDGQTINDEFGTVTVSVKGDKVTTTLVPAIGSSFPLKDTMGIITATDGTTFTVDGNHPLAGKDIVIDFEVVSLSKAKDVKTSPIN